MTVKKIIVTADLHLGITNEFIIRQFAKDIANENPTVVILAGDLAETIQRDELFGYCISFFRKAMPNTPILVLSGNHDLWVSEFSEYNSLDMWKYILKTQTENNRGIWLEEKNWISNDLAIVGSMLHYDYSAIDKTGVASGYPLEFFIQNKKRLVNDGRFLRGLPDDIVFAKQIGSMFRQRLEDMQNDSSIKDIIVVTHVPCLELQMTRRPHDMSWAMSTPFFGNLSHQEFILKCDKIRYVISAHSHMGSENNIGNMKIINLGSDYHNPEYRIITI